jgi:hypothetical protein
MCAVIHIADAPVRACSGKCRGGGCGAKPNVWVLAACEGKIALFSKQPDGHLLPLSKHGSNVSAFADTLRDRLVNAFEQGDFSQLVLVGSANDISWTQASLPVSVSKQVAAEIEYPLMPAWFGTPSDTGRLAQALETVFKT